MSGTMDGKSLSQITEERLAEHNEMLRRAKEIDVFPTEIWGGISCPDCKHLNSIGDVFCGMCGIEMYPSLEDDNFLIS